MIVMGLDQHRGQITAEWIETDTGEVSRARVAPAHREPVRRFLGRFRGLELEVALEATTGWRFVVEELRAIGAGVHLGEPAETSARRGNNKRAKSDRADARHLRELLMIRRLPGVLDPARSHPGLARAGAVAPHARRSARRVAAAHPGGALPPRAAAAPRSAHAREPCMGRAGRYATFGRSEGRVHVRSCRQSEDRGSARERSPVRGGSRRAASVTARRDRRMRLPGACCRGCRGRSRGERGAARAR
jgi:hypothetical protein